jgi:hypothetical protein
MNISLENLELLPRILEELEKLNGRLDAVSISSELRTGVQVQKYLDVSKSTLHNLVHSEKLVEGIHYTKDGDSKLEYISEAIVEFKKTYMKYAKGQHRATTEMNSFLNKFAA